MVCLQKEIVMAKKDWGPLTEAKKKDEITAAFNACVANGTALSLEPIKLAVYDWLAERYKFNQAKLSSSERFWANANYAKFIVHLTDLIAVEKTRREQIEAKVKQEQKGFGSRFVLNPSVGRYTLAAGSEADSSGVDGPGSGGSSEASSGMSDRWLDAGMEKESKASSNWWIWVFGGIVILYFLLKKR